jgi:nicotinamide phosphoribosyltransferase
MTQYPEGTTKVACNLTPRNFRYLREYVPKAYFNNKAVVLGLTSSIQEMNDSFNDQFFNRDREEVIKEFAETIRPFIGDNDDSVMLNNFRKLHDLGYLPLKFKIVPEGMQVGENVPVMLWYNTHPDFAWLPNYLETFLSSQTWKISTCATIAKVYKNMFDAYAEKTGSPKEFTVFQGHDFSSRGMSGIIDSSRSAVGHLSSFWGTDSISSIGYINKYYEGKKCVPFIGASVPATEHSVMCLGGKLTEVETYRRLLQLYPTGIVSIVSDTWDYWNVVTNTLRELKDEILARKPDSIGLCKTVIRPDSGCPEDIICGSVKNIQDYTKYGFEGAKVEAKYYIVDASVNATPHGERGDDEVTTIFKCDGKYYELTVEIDWNRHDKKFYYYDGSSIKDCKEITLTPEQKGTLECLWEIFGGTINEKGYKVLDPHIGLIYGDSITPNRCLEILSRMEAKGFASCNIVLGIGSATYQGGVI